MYMMVTTHNYQTPGLGELLLQQTSSIFYRSQVGFGFVFMVSDSDSQFRIRKSNTKLENLKVIPSSFKEN